MCELQLSNNFHLKKTVKQLYFKIECKWKEKQFYKAFGCKCFIYHNGKDKFDLRSDEA